MKLKFIKKKITNLVRLGGAGAVFPLLFVVLLICTILFLHPPVNVDNLVPELILSKKKKKELCFSKPRLIFHTVCNYNSLIKHFTRRRLFRKAN